MARTRLKIRKRLESGTFILIPTDVLRSMAFRSLSTKAKALILDLGTQYNGRNNGHLSAAWTLMRQQGWVSKQTLQAAQEELLDKGLLELSRQGGRHRCSLYGYTWIQIHDGKASVRLDVPTTKVASGTWRRYSEAMAGDDAKKSTSASPIIGALWPDHRGSQQGSAS